MIHGSEAGRFLPLILPKYVVLKDKHKYTTSPEHKEFDNKFSQIFKKTLQKLFPSFNFLLKCHLLNEAVFTDLLRYNSHTI